MNKKQLFSDGTVFSEKTERIGKKILLGFIVFIIFLGILDFLDGPDSNNYAVKRTPASAITKTVMIRQVDIKVTSQNVKKVDKKYRYFFDIRNHDSIPFSGTVKIELYNKDGGKVFSDSFTTNPAIEPSIGKSVYIDAYTGTSDVHGEAGVTNFKFEVMKDKSVVTSGSGEIK